MKPLTPQPTTAGPDSTEIYLFEFYPFTDFGNQGHGFRRWPVQILKGTEVFLSPPLPPHVCTFGTHDVFFSFRTGAFST
jgi:hypothetical protein